MVDAIAITSYNRGAALWKCLKSCIEYAETPIYIFDDASDDEETRWILDCVEREQIRNPLPYYRDQQIVVRRFPDSRGSNWNNQRALIALRAKAFERWALIDDDLIFTGNWLDAVEEGFAAGWHHLYLDNPSPNLPKGSRPRGCFLAGTQYLLDRIGGFDLERYRYGCGGAHPDWTKRAQRAGLAPLDGGVILPYRLQAVPSVANRHLDAWLDAGIEYEDLGRGNIWKPLELPARKLSHATP